MALYIPASAAFILRVTRNSGLKATPEKLFKDALERPPIYVSTLERIVVPLGLVSALVLALG